MFARVSILKSPRQVEKRGQVGKNSQYRTKFMSFGETVLAATITWRPMTAVGENPTSSVVNVTVVAAPPPVRSDVCILHSEFITCEFQWAVPPFFRGPSFPVKFANLKNAQNYIATVSLFCWVYIILGLPGLLIVLADQAHGSRRPPSQMSWRNTQVKAVGQTGKNIDINTTAAGQQPSFFPHELSESYNIIFLYCCFFLVIWTI